MMRTSFVCTNGFIYICDANRGLLNKSLAVKAMSEFLKEFTQISYNEEDLMNLISENRENTENFWKGQENGICEVFRTQNVRLPMKDLQILDNYSEIHIQKKNQKKSIMTKNL